MATWRDRLQPASFRSIPFQVDADSIGVGRRTQVHEYTKRDTPYVEDLGRATREFDVTGFVIGDDCFEQADKLLEAFETAGPGELLHPWLGRMKVSAVGKPQFKRDRREGGMIRFDVSFVESGELSFPATSLNTSQKLATSASNLADASQSNFAKVLDSVNTAKVNIASYMTTAKVLYATYSAQISPFVDAFTDAEALADFSVSLPGVFGEELYSALDSVTHVFTGTAGALSSAISISGNIDDVAAVPAAPGADTAAFQSATVQLTQDALLVDVMRKLATIVVPVGNDVDVTPGPRDPEAVSSVDSQTLTPAVQYDEAGDQIYPVDIPVVDDVIVVRDTLSEVVWEMALTASYDRYQALTDARQAIVQHLNEVAKNGVRLVTVKPLEAIPALVLAYQRYGDASRADEIVTRNKVANPAFVPPIELHVAEK